MIFNNQQLVAFATYKPDNEKSFISIYELGKKKYDLYGKAFIYIIKNYKESKCAT
ncbi:MAG: HRDC domain-containing protein [Clostridia bacterium]|nr:HRDC domain-containing protein [Clostridia bacterium]